MENDKTNGFGEESTAISPQYTQGASNVLSFPPRYLNSSIASQSNYYIKEESASPKPDDVGMTSIAQGIEMAAPTREEIDAKLEAVEARTETRFLELSNKIDRLADAVGHASESYVKANGSLVTAMDAVRADNKFTRATIIVAVVGSIIAGLAALWVTQSNMLASFQAGIALHESSSTQPPPPKAN